MIYVVGIGPGHPDYLLPIAQQIISQCDWLVGSPRQLATIHHATAKHHVLDSQLSQLYLWLEAHHEELVVVLASGDPLFYGIGHSLCQQFGQHNIHIIPGISSVNYLFSQLGLSMNDVYLTSSHGKTPNFDFILQHDKVALVTDKQIGPYQIAQQIIQRGLQRKLIIGENLSYANEIIQCLPAEQVSDTSYAMNVVIILNER